VSQASAPAKINLALVVGPRRDDGKHEVATVLQGLALADTITLTAAPVLRVSGFAEDTLVRDALLALAAHARVEPRWAARICKRIPVAAGLGGGSSDAAAALRLANESLEEHVPEPELHALAASLGSDVAFFLESGSQLGVDDGSELRPLELPQHYHVLLILPDGIAKPSTRAVYQAFDARGGEQGFEARRLDLLSALEHVASARDLSDLPPNDLASSPFAARLRALGAFRADVSGAGPTVYGLFERRAQAEAARRALRDHGHSWLTAPAC
jgi:4-diphosphocytidyl-2-C-methyl-D-erythritol kinase